MTDEINHSNENTEDVPVTEIVEQETPDLNSMMANFWGVVLEERSQQGVSVNLLTVDDADTFSALSIGELALASISTNVVLDVSNGTLIFIAPDASFNFHIIDGIAVGTEMLPVGRALVGGAMIVGTNIGDVVFPDYTVTVSLVGEMEIVSAVKMLQVERPTQEAK